MSKTKTTRIKGSAANNFMAVMLVDDLGEKALEKCAKDSPMYKAVKEIIKSRKELEK